MYEAMLEAMLPRPASRSPMEGRFADGRGDDPDCDDGDEEPDAGRDPDACDEPAGRDEPDGGDEPGRDAPAAELLGPGRDAAGRALVEVELPDARGAERALLDGAELPREPDER